MCVCCFSQVFHSVCVSVSVWTRPIGRRTRRSLTGNFDDGVERTTATSTTMTIIIITITAFTTTGIHLSIDLLVVIAVLSWAELMLMLLLTTTATTTATGTIYFTAGADADAVADYCRTIVTAQTFLCATMSIFIASALAR